MASTTPCTCTCETTDSALSITANIISVITLAYVLLVSIGYRVAVHQRRNRQTVDLSKDIEELQLKLQRLTKDEDFLRFAAGFSTGRSSIEQRLERLLREVQKIEDTSQGWHLIWQELRYSHRRERCMEELSRLEYDADFMLTIA